MTHLHCGPGILSTSLCPHPDYHQYENTNVLMHMDRICHGMLGIVTGIVARRAVFVGHRACMARYKPASARLAHRPSVCANAEAAPAAPVTPAPPPAQPPGPPVGEVRGERRAAPGSACGRRNAGIDGLSHRVQYRCGP